MSNNVERIKKWFDHFTILLGGQNLMQKTISNQQKLIMKPTYKYPQKFLQRMNTLL